MRRFEGGFKQYVRTTPNEILRFVKTEIEQENIKTVEPFDSLTLFDLSQQVCYKILLDDRVVGFACAKWTNGDLNSRRLTKIYITPSARRHGCATFVIKGLKIALITIPIRNVIFIGLCIRLGFTYCPRQEYPTAVAQLHRRTTS